MGGEYTLGKGHGTPRVLVNDATLNDSDKIFAVPNGEYWNIQFISCGLVSTAVVGNRLLRVEIGDGTSLWWFKAWGAVQAASLTRYYYAAKDLPDDVDFDAAGRIRMRLELDMILPPGWTVRVYDITAVDPAADDLTVRVQGDKIPIA